MPLIYNKIYTSSVNRSKKTTGKDCAMKTLWYTETETKDQIACAGSLGALMMTHYNAIALQPNPDMEDETLARMLGKGKSTITKARLKLTKGGWFMRILDKRKGRESVVYIVGKAAVDNYMNKGRVAIQSPKTKGE